jgi:hypothetical protein
MHQASTSPPRSRLQSLLSVIVLVQISLLFWLSRIAYWNTTAEFPFSDMADFERVARAILREWSFQMDAFWMTYKPPILPLFRAAAIFLFGESLQAWRISVGLMTFAALGWFICELARLRSGRWFAIGVFFIISISKSSLFWSLKMSTEGLAEMFIYLSFAACLFCLRKPSPRVLFLCGAILMTSALHRPNSVPLMPSFLGVFLILRWLRKPSPAAVGSAVNTASIPMLLCSFCLALTLVWSPWLIRSYRLYGAIVPFNTSGSLSFAYGLETVRIVQEDGSEFSTSYDQIMASATSRYKNDYEVYKATGSLVSTWISQNRAKIPAMILQRAQQDVLDRDVQLTRVSRQRLLPDPYNMLLLDKSPALVAIGLLGLFALPLLGGWILAFVPLSIFGYWLSSLLCMANPRLLEPILPLILSGNLVWPFLVWRVLARGSRQKSANAQWLHRASLYLMLFFFTLTTLYLGALALAMTGTRPSPQPLALRNGSFELWDPAARQPHDWTVGGEGVVEIAGDGVQRSDGALSLRANLVSGSPAIYQDVLPTLFPIEGKDFLLTARVRGELAGSAYLAISDGKKWITSELNKKAGEWEELKIQSIFSETVTGLRVHLYVSKGSVHFDQVQLTVQE